MKGGVAVVALDNPVAGSMDSVKVIAIGGLPGIPRETDITSLDLGADANPEGVALTPDGRFGVVDPTGVKTLAYVDLTGLAPALLAGGTKVARGAFGVTVTPDGTRALVTRKIGGTLSIVDLTGLPIVPGAAAVRTFAVGDSPGAVAVTADGGTAVIAEAGSSDAARIVDLSALTSTTVSLVSPTAANPDPFGVAIMAGPGGPQAVITDTAAGTVSIVTSLATPSSGRSTPARPAGPRDASRQGAQGWPLDRVEQRCGSPLGDLRRDQVLRSRRRDRLVHIHIRRRHIGGGPVPIVTHTYTVVGSPAGLVVTDDDGATFTAVLTSVQVAVNKAPKAALKASATTGKAPFLVTFDASRSSDSDGTIASYTFTFGDGSSVTTSDSVVSHTYVSAGKYTAGVVSTDNGGAASSPATAGVEAKANKPPTAAFRAQPSAGTAPLVVTFTDQSKDSDGQVVAVRWDFGDGAGGAEQNPTHLYAVPGKFVVTLTATDDNGAMAGKTSKVEVESQVAARKSLKLGARPPIQWRRRALLAAARDDRYGNSVPLARVRCLGADHVGPSPLPVRCPSRRLLRPDAVSRRVRECPPLAVGRAAGARFRRVVGAACSAGGSLSVRASSAAPRSAGQARIRRRLPGDRAPGRQSPAGTVVG